MKRYLFVSSGLVILALFLSYQNLGILVPFGLGVALLVDASVLRRLFRWKFVLFLALLVFAIPVFIGQRNAMFYGIPYSPEIFRMSLVMAFRSVTILTAIKIFTSHISVEQMALALQRVRLKQFSHVFTISMRILPEIRAITLDTFREYRTSLRGNNILTETFDWTVKLIVRLLYFADRFDANQPSKGE